LYAMRYTHTHTHTHTHNRKKGRNGYTGELGYAARSLRETWWMEPHMKRFT